MKEEYRFIQYRPEYKEQVLALREFGWGIDRGFSLRFFEWKHEENPYLNTPLVYLVLHADRVVGTGGLYGIKWEGGRHSQEFTAIGVGDIVAHPEHQSRGIIRGLQRAALNDLATADYAYLFALSARPVVYLRCLRAGWRAAGCYETVSWSGGAGGAAACMQRLKKLGGFWKSSPARVRPPFCSFDRKCLRRKFASEFRVSVELNPRPQEMADLIRRTPHDGRIRHVRDEEYFRWRFRNPLSTYRFLFCKDKALEGYLILQMSVNAKNQEARIVDWEAANITVREELLDMALFYLDGGRLVTWSATLPDDVKILLRNKGFMPRDDTRGVKHYKPGVILRPIRDEFLNEDWIFADRQLLDMNNWDLRMAYSDGY